MMDIGFYNRICIQAPTEVLISDPCQFGEPRILTVAHIAGACRRSYSDKELGSSLGQEPDK